MDYRKILKSIIYGVAIGDALGVPYEFKPRGVIQLDPCKTMVGYGTHMQTKGTWSDDTSLTLCLVDGLDFVSYSMNIKRIVENIIKWYDYGEFSAHYEVFDYGGTVASAIARMKQGYPFFECGGADINENGNGSLMRVAPLSLYVYNEPNIKFRYNIVQNISSLTHRHIISILGCFIYVELMYLILQDKAEGKLKDKKSYVLSVIKELNQNGIYHNEYSLILTGELFNVVSPDYIQSSGYVVHTLEAALYSFLQTSTYKDCVLYAVNLGNDTDTTAAVAGGLAGLYYGFEAIPSDWVEVLANKSLIDTVIRKSTCK